MHHIQHPHPTHSGVDMTEGNITGHLIRFALPLLAGVVLFYQTAGTLGEWAFTGSAAAAVQDFRIGIPGMLAQAAGGYLIINYLLRK